MSQQQNTAMTNAATNPVLFQTNNTYYEQNSISRSKKAFQLTSELELINVRRELNNIFTGTHPEFLTGVP
jgi:hypothetical protein